MIILKSTTSLELKLGGSITTSQLPFYVAYVDSTSINYTPSNANGISNNTTVVTMISSPASGETRTIKYISLNNSDSTSVQVILQVNESSTVRKIIDFNLDSGDRLEYTDTVGFRVLTSTGQIKTGSSGSGMIYPSSGIAVSSGTNWVSSITDNSTNWNTSYGWGNHASAGYLTGITSLQVTTALGYTPVTNARTLTINGTTYDLSADRTWTISASASLSGLTAATATNTINSTDKLQEWQWNSLAAGTGLKLSSTSTGAASNTQKILEVSQSGANANPSQTTFGAVFSNTKTGTTSTNVGLSLSASGGTYNYPLITSGGNIGINTTTPTNTVDVRSSVNGSISGLRLVQESIPTPTEQRYIGSFYEVPTTGLVGSIYGTSSTYSFASATAMAANSFAVTSNATSGQLLLGAAGSSGYISITTGGLQTTNERIRILANGNIGVNTTTPSSIFEVNTGTGGASKGIGITQASNNGNASISYSSIDFTVPTTGLIGQFLSTASNYTNAGVNLAANSVALLSYATSGQLLLGAMGASGYVNFNTGGFASSNERMRITSSGNIGIGTTTPNASAKLELSSTTQGFLPPRMTATQASAISSPAKSLMLYVTDTNGTFTSAGLWIYTTSWKLIIAE